MASLTISNAAPEPPPAPAVQMGTGDVQRVTVSREDLPKPPPKDGTDNKQPEGERPAWLPDKFKSAEDLAKAYKELETKLGQPKTPPAEPTKPPPAPTQDQAKQQVENAGLDFSEFTQEYAEKGALSKASLEKLTSKGISADTVNAYIEGQKALAEQRNSRLADTVGGQENLKSIFAWAQANLSEAQIKAANAALSGSEEQAALVLQGLKSQYVSATGTEPKRVTGGTAPPSGVEPFKSSAEVSAAMRDPRYRTDPAYREKVTNRLAASPTFGNHRG